MEKYEELLQFVQNLKPDFEKFYGKNQAAAGTRLRKSMSDLKKIAQDLRLEIQQVKTERKEEK